MNDFIRKFEVLYIFIIKILMSKPSLSPYRRNAYNNPRPGLSPIRQEPYKLAQKSKLSHSLIADQATDKKIATSRQQILRGTDKKRPYQLTAAGHSRVETLIEQNKFLLSENNELANLLNDRSRIIIALEQKLEQQIAQEVQTLEQIQFEKNRFLQEYAHKMRQHSAKNECLMDEIAQLNEDIYQLQLKKNREIQHIKESYSRQHKNQLDNILNNHTHTVQIMQIENSKLKQIIGNRDNQIQCLNHQLKSTNDRLKNKCDELQKNITHILHMKKLELSEQKIEYQKIIQDIKRECDKLQEMTTTQYQNEIKRVKKQLFVKHQEAEKLSNDISSHNIDSAIKINQLYQKKGELQNEIVQLENFQKKLLFQETQRIKNLAQAELDNNDIMSKQLIQNLKAENAKLMQLNETRANEATRLYVQIEDLRFKNDKECEDLRVQIANLKALVHEQKQSYDEENEALKTKIAQLRHADVHSLQQYYQNQLATMAEDLQAKDKIIQDNRDKLHHEIQEKTELRKNFDIQVSKLKIKIGQLQLRIAGIVHQKKQQLASFGSQMQLTSLTLLRTAEQKQKYAIFSQSQKNRLQKMIQNKDIEIEQLNEKIALMNDNHGLQINNKNEQIEILKKTIEQLESNLKKQKFFLENEVKKKEAINKNDKQFYESQLTRVKKDAAEQQKRIISEFNKQKALIDQQRIRLRKQQQRLSGKLKMQQQFRQQQNIDKQIALNESMGRITSQKQLLQVNLKTFYKRQMKLKDQQIQDLRQQISQLNTDIRSHIEKQQKLQQKLQKLLESQEKLRDMEQRVIALGQQNNLVKNLSEIVKNRRR